MGKWERKKMIGQNDIFNCGAVLIGEEDSFLLVNSLYH